MDKDTQAIQNKIQNELKLYKATQKGKQRFLKDNYATSKPDILNIIHSVQLFVLCLSDLSKVISKRQMLDAQMSENKSVLEELNGMTTENKV